MTPTQVAEAACAAEGVTIFGIIENRPRAKGRNGPIERETLRVFARVVARCRRSPDAPSLPELAKVFQAPYSVVHAAAARGFTILDAADTVEQIERHGIDGLIAIGQAAANRLRVSKPSRPMFDDGESDA